MIKEWVYLGFCTVSLAQARDPGLAVTVRVYNYAHLSSEIVAHGEQEAAQVYSRVGVALRWVICPTQPQQGSPAGERVTRPVLALRLLPERMTTRISFKPDAYGLALVPDDGEFGIVANVFADRVRTLAGDDKSSMGAILGHVMAHELGHLLLGIRYHAVAGIMRSGWQIPDLEKIRQGTMFFLPEQAARIRAQVISRGASGE